MSENRTVEQRDRKNKVFILMSSVCVCVTVFVAFFLFHAPSHFGASLCLFMTLTKASWGVGQTEMERGSREGRDGIFPLRFFFLFY